MDKKELLKRWMLAYTEPSLFYVPWKKSNKKEYGEYVKITFDIYWETFELWQRDPVFAIYKIDDSDPHKEELIYATAVYDDSDNVVRSALGVGGFIVASEHGYMGYYQGNSSKYKMLLLSGKYKIRMLCSGSGMLTNNSEEWIFTVEQNEENKSPLYDNGTYCYRYREIEISPFKGYKYIGISSEINEIGKVNIDAKLKDETERTVSVSGDIAIYDNNPYHFQGGMYIQYIAAAPMTDLIKQPLYKKYYIGEFCINEYLGVKTGIYTPAEVQLLTERGRKQIVVNSSVKPNSITSYESYYVQNTSSLNIFSISNDEYSPDFNYSFSYGKFASKKDFYADAPIFSGDSYKRHVGDIRFGGDCHQIFNEYDTSDIHNSYVYFESNQSIHVHHADNSDEYYKIPKMICLSTGRIIRQQYSLNYTGIELPDMQVTIEADENTLSKRYSAYSNIEKDYQDAVNTAFLNRYKSNDYSYNDIIKIPFSYFLTNINPVPKSSEKVCTKKLTTETIENKMIISEEQVDEKIVYYDSSPILNDLGTNWEGYDNYIDEPAWRYGILHNSEIEVYHPELIPKEKAGET